ncbi:MAG: TIR domain-containing protein [Oscillospiraceae bacterium]|nr:TIR domain-containing protein [Oscillospiraceae bacterium]
MKLFLSHCTDDRNTVDILAGAMQTYCPDLTLFLSSRSDTGIDAGDYLHDRIDQELTDCDCVIAVITKNYLRSMYCMYEFSLALYMSRGNQQKRFIPIFQSAAEKEHCAKLLGDITYIIADSETDNLTNTLVNTLPPAHPDKLPALQVGTLHFLEALSSASVSQRPYIGMQREEYQRIQLFCENNGIIQFCNGGFSGEYIKSKLLSPGTPLEDIYILSTTGASIIKALSQDAFVQALQHGVNIHVIIPNQYSDFCRDVADIESMGKPQQIKDENSQRLAGEYNSVMVYLQDACSEARKGAHDAPLGHITCYCSFTILRQTIFLARRSDGSLWGTCSMTTPPKKTIDKTLMFEFQGREGVGTPDTLLGYCRAIMALAKERDAFFAESHHARQYWAMKFSDARAEMEDALLNGDDILIEVAAQHPLKLGTKPGSEFRARLDRAIELYTQYQKDGIQTYIYVPGSRHMYNGKVDKISLGEAGKQYLLSKGIPEDDILADETSQEYMSQYGVYNSADECYVASRIFHDGDFRSLMCVCSPNQVARKTLFYIENGIIPQCYSVPMPNMFHNIFNELFDTIPNVLYRDHSWQDHDTSQASINSRLERMPKDGQ